MGEIRVHLADQIDRLLDRVEHAVDVGTAQTAPPGAMHDVNTPGVPGLPVVRDLSGAIGRLVVHDEHTYAVVPQQALEQHRKIGAFVVRGYDDEYRRRHYRRSVNQREDTCSETSPMRKITRLARISSTEEFVTCDCVTMVQMAYAAPLAKQMPHAGRKIRMGL